MALNKRVAIAVAGIVLLGGATVLWFSHGENANSGRVTLYGNVDIRQIELAFNGSERIAEMLAVEGQTVHRGEVLGKLETTRLQDAVAEARARVDAQNQVVARLETGSRPEEIRKARADVDAARARLENAGKEYHRAENLVAQGVTSQARLDGARAERDAAAAQVKAAEQTLALARTGPRKEDIRAARATLKADEAALRLAQSNLADAVLRSPADAVVQTRVLEPGDMASPQRPAYTLALTDPVWVRTYVSETELGKIHPGMKATITTDSFPDKSYEGWIGYISPTAEFTPKSVETREVRTSLVYQVRVFVCNPQNQLRLGMPATVEIDVDANAGTMSGDPCKAAQ